MPLILLGAKLIRLTSRRNRLDDLGRQEGERQNAADVAVTDPFDARQLGHGADPAGDQSIKAAVGSLDFLQQHRIGTCRLRAGSVDDELPLHAAPLDPHSVTSAGTQGFRHRRQTNVAYCDGHAESQRDRFTAGNPNVVAGPGFLGDDNTLYDLD